MELLVLADACYRRIHSEGEVAISPLDGLVLAVFEVLDGFGTLKEAEDYSEQLNGRYLQSGHCSANAIISAVIFVRQVARNPLGMKVVLHPSVHEQFDALVDLAEYPQRLELRLV